MTGAMRASALAQEDRNDGPACVEVEQALEALLGVPVSLGFQEKAGQLTLHFRTINDVEALLRTLLAARGTEASGAATSAGPAAPPPPGAPGLRLVPTAPSQEVRRARPIPCRDKARNVAAYGPRPDPVRQ